MHGLACFLSANHNHKSFSFSFNAAEADLDTVFREVATIQISYSQIGRELGLPAYEIDIIKEENKCVDQRFTSVLHLWLKEGYDVKKHGHPTWRKLVKVVDSPTGGKNHSLAKTIAAQHPSGICMLFIIATLCNMASHSFCAPSCCVTTICQEY